MSKALLFCSMSISIKRNVVALLVLRMIPLSSASAVGDTVFFRMVERRWIVPSEGGVDEEYLAHIFF